MGVKQFSSQGEQNIREEVQKLNDIMDRFDKSSTRISKAMLWMTAAILLLTFVMVIKMFM